MYFTFQGAISDRLWDIIKSNYENENYSGAILDAVFCLTEVIKERTDVDLDGIALIGKAFGGDSPLLKVNALRTETDKNQQKGIESILRGIYQAIRNPRAHEKTTDDKPTCNTILLFINYLIFQIEKAKTQFDFDEFFKRILDPDFVESSEYSDLLISEVPETKMFDLLLHIFNKRESADPSKIYFIISSCIAHISPEQYTEFVDYVNNLLKSTTVNHDFIIVLKIFADEKWNELDLVARLRVENKLLKSFEKGIYNIGRNKCIEGTLVQCFPNSCAINRVETMI